MARNNRNSATAWPKEDLILSITVFFIEAEMLKNTSSYLCVRRQPFWCISFSIFKKLFQHSPIIDCQNASLEYSEHLRQTFCEMINLICCVSLWWKAFTHQKKTAIRVGKRPSRISGEGQRVETVPLLSDAELLMSPVMKEDSDCFLTVSFHIRRMRLCGDKQHVKTCQNIHSVHAEG